MKNVEVVFRYDVPTESSALYKGSVKEAINFISEEYGDEKNFEIVEAYPLDN